jgi:hypothetical protein
MRVTALTSTRTLAKLLALRDKDKAKRKASPSPPCPTRLQLNAAWSGVLFVVKFITVRIARCCLLSIVLPACNMLCYSYFLPSHSLPFPRAGNGSGRKVQNKIKRVLILLVGELKSQSTNN